MNTHMQTDAWIYRIVVVLGLTAAVSVVGTITLMAIRWPIPELILALGSIASGGLVRILISPLNQRLYE